MTCGRHPAHFTGARWVLREPGSGTRNLSAQALSVLPPGETVLELHQTEAIKQAVIAGLGIAFLPEVAVTDAAAAGRLKVLKTRFLDLRPAPQALAGAASGPLPGRTAGSVPDQSADKP